MTGVQRGFAGLLAGVLSLNLLLTGCAAANAEQPPAAQPMAAVGEQGGLVAEQILDGADGEIHYSYTLPENYDPARTYPLVMAMPGYGEMWFGEDSSGRNLNWSGFRNWTELDEPMIVVSAQLTDWGEKSARQAVELTEYFIENFSVDTSRVYAAGYSAGGETMSRAVSMRPDLYAAYLHAASQWDGTYAPLAEQRVAVYIFMGENDEYYGSRKARDAYDGLLAAYREAGMTEEEIGELLVLNIPDDAWFNERGVTNYHGGGNLVFDDSDVLNWIAGHGKEAQSAAVRFLDVPSGAWYAEAVRYVSANGLMSGTGVSIFSPDEPASRAMLATILYRAAGSPNVKASTGFSDVTAGTWYSDAVEWAAQNGIINGYGGGRFGPDDPVTREQLATVLWRYAGSPAAAGEDYADESAIAAFAAGAVDWARSCGAMTGKGENRFDPKGGATRAELAMVLLNYFAAEEDGGTSGGHAGKESDPMEIPQTGWTKAVPVEYTQAAREQGSVTRLDYTSEDYVRNGAAVTKTAYVYTPYGYDENDTETQYDILYLMHGWGGRAGEYFDFTGTKNMFDNLIANGDIPPLIIVSATFYNENSNTDFSSSIAEFRQFHRDFEDHLMPAVEGRFHTYARSTSQEDLKASRDHRAFGGFSLGSVTTWLQFCYDYDYIRYFLPMSGSCWYYGTYGDFQTEKNVDFIEQLVKEENLDERGYFIYHAVGTEDAVKSQTIMQAEEMLDRSDVFTPDHYLFYQKDGGYHDFNAVQEYLYNALPLFFRDGQMV